RHFECAVLRLKFELRTACGLDIDNETGSFQVGRRSGQWQVIPGTQLEGRSGLRGQRPVVLADAILRPRMPIAQPKQFAPSDSDAPVPTGRLTLVRTEANTQRDDILSGERRRRLRQGDRPVEE